MQVAGGEADVRRGEGEEGADGGVQSGGEKCSLSSISTFETEQFLYLKSKERVQHGNLEYQMQLI